MAFICGFNNMNMFMGSVQVVSVSSEILKDNSTRYQFTMEIDQSFEDYKGVFHTRIGHINGVGVPKRHHMERWAAIEEEDTVYVTGTLTPGDDGTFYLKLTDLGLKWEE